MFSPWIDVHDVNGQHWVNLWAEIIALQSLRERPRRPPLVVFHEDGQIVKILLGQKVLPGGGPYPSFEGLQALGKQHNAGLVLGVETQAIQRLFEHFEQRMRYGEDFLTYVGHIAAAVASAREVGIDIVPGRIVRGLPPRLLLDQFFNLVFPNQTSMALYVFDEGQLYASLILSKQDGLLSRISTDDGLGVGGVQAAHWREDVPRLKQELEKRFGRLWACAFMERQAIRQLALGKLDWPQAIEQGLVVTAPWPYRFRFIEWIWRMGRPKRTA